MQEIDIDKLVLNENIVTTPNLIIDYYAYVNGEPVLCISTKHPLRKIFFITDDVNLESFYSNKITLSDLFLKSSSNIIVIVIDNEVKYFMKNDIEIELETLNKYLKGLKFLSIKK